MTYSRPKDSIEPTELRRQVRTLNNTVNAQQQRIDQLLYEKTYSKRAIQLFINACSSEACPFPFREAWDAAIIALKKIK